MLNNFDKTRIKQIYQLLLEMAEGRFSFQIARNDSDDEIEALVILVNLMAEESEQTLQYYSQLNSPEAILEFVQMVFILDVEFIIRYANKDAELNLNKGANELTNQHFKDILASDSKQKWESIAINLRSNINYTSQEKLQFVSENELLKTAICKITPVPTKVLKQPFFVVTSFQSKTQSQFLEDGLDLRLQAGSGARQPKEKPNILKNVHDIQIITRIHDYILQHLEEPLPTLPTLAHNFGTNEYKLKYGFKQLYHSTVFKFLIDERLKKASLLIENTCLPIKRVAVLTGFKSLAHFSKAFKNKYGYSPKQFRTLTSHTP